MIRQNMELVEQKLTARGVAPEVLTHSLTLDEKRRELLVQTEELKKYIDRRVAAANVADARYNQAVQQELLKDIAVNPGAGGLAGAGAGLGIGLAAGSAFASMSSSTFSQQQVPVTPAQSDPMEVLGKLKKLLDAGLITQEKYDAKVDEIMSNL